MNHQPQLKKRSRLIVEAMDQRQDGQQWEEFIVAMLSKLELSPEKHAAAKKRYEELGRHVANKLSVGENDVHIIVQGSMRTQTTIAGDGRENFDLDVVVKLSGPRFEGLRESEQFFKQFGASLEGIDGSGKPDAKNRCWRLPYPGESFYFDVTPAIPMSEEITDTDLRVRDPIKTWSPSNPEEFASWFCDIANKRFPFQDARLRRVVAMDEAHIDPLPKEKVRIDDILRRMTQLMKLHRDSYYKMKPDSIKEGKPISVILVTLATKAYNEIITNDARQYSSAIEVALEVIERMPKFIQKDLSVIRVDNPALKGKFGENFADKWNSDKGLREREFKSWHEQLKFDLDALFSEEYSKRSENRISGVFGEQGVRAWKESLPQGILGGLLSSAPTQSKTQPQAPRQSGYRNALA